MFWHNFKNSLKVLLKNKMLIFWTFAFPIMLGIFFKMAFSDIEKNEKLDIIKIAVIDDEQFNSESIFKESFKALSEGENKIFDITYTNYENASELLLEKSIIGYFYVDNGKSNIVVNSNGINETIFRNSVDMINSNKIIIGDLINKGKDINFINELIKDSNVKLNDISRKNLSYTMIEYYTLIAMTCMYGGLLSMFIINKRLPNCGSVGMRTIVSPTNKGIIIFGSLFASFLVQIVGVLLILAFTKYVLGAYYGDNMLLVIILAIVGSFAGLSLGMAIATLIRSNENTKIGVLIAVTMLGCFLSGMMGITMKYVIDKNVSIINKLNPLSMLTDGFYSLYYYDSLDRYIFNIFSLVLFSFVMIAISYKGLRRQKYDSI